MIWTVDIIGVMYHHEDMTSKELQITLRDMGVSGAQMARWLNVTPLTVTRWKTGATPIPGPASIAMEALSTGWRPKS